MPATTMIIIQPGADLATFETRSVDLPEGECWKELVRIVVPILRVGREDASLERMQVLYDGQYRDMFIDEQGGQFELPRNELATKIYRHNWLTKHPETDPRNMPAIHGVAILFTDRRVWT